MTFPGPSLRQIHRMVSRNTNSMHTMHKRTNQEIVENIDQHNFPDYTGSDSKIGLCQEGFLSLSQAKPAPKQLNLTKLSDGSGLKGKIMPTQAEPIFLNVIFSFPFIHNLAMSSVAVVKTWVARFSTAWIIAIDLAGIPSLKI
jgi:hypothetical protein